MPALTPKMPWQVRRLATGVAIAAALSLTVALNTRAQMGPATGAKLELAGAAVAARHAFFSGVDDLANVFPGRGLARLEEALKLDPGFGLARVFWARQAPGMTMEARTAELDRGVADAAKGSAGEAAFAMALRAQRLGRPDEARSLFRTARQLLPGDPWVGYYATLGLLGTNSTPAEVLVAQQRLTTQFPDLAPAYNNLAYGLYRAGDRAGGLEAIRKYAELAPNHPNAKDSYAELLQWEGRLDEAVALYRDAARLEPSYGAAFTGIADARQLQGRGADARAALGEGLAGATTPAAKANLHRLIALSFAADGDRKGAEAALAAAMSEANAAGGAGLISGVHRDFAQVLVMAGDKGGVASHLAATTNPNPLLLAVDAMMLAAAGLNAEAKAKLQEAERGADADGNDNARARFPIVRALILVNEGSGEAALAEIAKGNITLPTAKAVMALAEQQRKNTPVARMLRDGVRSDMVYALGNRELALARSLAARVK